MILSPRKSVTRFFIPLIDVLILLFCIFLLMPFVSSPEAPEPDTKTPPEAPLPKDAEALQKMVKDLTAQLKEEKLRVERMERERQAKLTDQLVVQVLRIDPKDGTLYYFDRAVREEIRSEGDAERLILKQKTVTGGKDVYFLIVYPRPAGTYPTAVQLDQYRKWFKSVPFGEEF